MKKFLSLLTVITLTASSTTSVVSCNNKPSQTEIEKIYNKLNNQNLTIQDDNLWGNNNSNLIYADIKKAIKTKLKLTDNEINKYLWFDKNKFTNLNHIKGDQIEEKQKINIFIDNSFNKSAKKAIINLTWKLTDNQKPIYGIYSVLLNVIDDIATSTIHNIKGKFNFVGNTNWLGSGNNKGWVASPDITSGTWDTKLNKTDQTKTIKTKLIQKIYRYLNDELKKKNFSTFTSQSDFSKYINFKNANLSITIGSYQEESDIKITNNTASFNLYYYNNSQRKKTFKFYYNNLYNEVQNQLKNQKTLYIPKSALHQNSKDKKYYANDLQNQGILQDSLDQYREIYQNLSFVGQLIPSQTNNIKVFYKEIDQNFTIPIKVI